MHISYSAMLRDGLTGHTSRDTRSRSLCLRVMCQTSAQIQIRAAHDRPDEQTVSAAELRAQAYQDEMPYVESLQRIFRVLRVSRRGLVCDSSVRNTASCEDVTAIIGVELQRSSCS